MKILIILGIYLILCSNYNIIYAKYILQNEFYIANINIDRTKPKIEFMDIENIDILSSNPSIQAYNMTIKLKFIEQNLENIFLDKEHIKVKINDKYMSDFEFEFNELEDKKKEKVYELKLKKIQINGKLKIELIEGTNIDKGGLKNDLFEIETYLEIENLIDDSYYESEFEEGEEENKNEFKEIEELEYEKDEDKLEDDVE